MFVSRMFLSAVFEYFITVESWSRNSLTSVKPEFGEITLQQEQNKDISSYFSSIAVYLAVYYLAVDSLILRLHALQSRHQTNSIK